MKTVIPAELKNQVGQVIILMSSDEGKIVAKVDKVDAKGEFLHFTQVGGKDDGKKFKARFDQSATEIKVFDPDKEMALALLE